MPEEKYATTVGVMLDDADERKPTVMFTYVTRAPHSRTEAIDAVLDWYKEHEYVPLNANVYAFIKIQD